MEHPVVVANGPLTRMRELSRRLEHVGIDVLIQRPAPKVGNT